MLNIFCDVNNPTRAQAHSGINPLISLTPFTNRVKVHPQIHSAMKKSRKRGKIHLRKINTRVVVVVVVVFETLDIFYIV